jgi:hypothetical protein
MAPILKYKSISQIYKNMHFVLNFKRISALGMYQKTNSFLENFAT